MSNAKKIAIIANNEGEQLYGFKILGVFPFYLKHIKNTTHIKICELRDEMQEIKGNNKASINDFYNTELMKKTLPLINKLITKALINKRLLGFILYPFIKRKVDECSNEQKKDLYKKILELSDASFFLSYYQDMITKDYTLLKEE